MKILASLLLILVAGCTSQPGGPLFTLVPPEDTGIDFQNTLGYDYDFNVYRYRNFYNGEALHWGMSITTAYRTSFLRAIKPPTDFT